MAIIIGNATASAQWATSTMSFNHTLGTGSNFIAIFVGTRGQNANGPVVTHCYYGPGDPNLLTLKTTKDYVMSMYMHAFYKVAPLTGTNIVYIYLASYPFGVIAIAVDYKFVNQSNPFLTSAVAGAGGTEVSVTMAGGGHTILAHGNDEQTTHSPGGGLTELYDGNSNFGQGAAYACAMGMADGFNVANPGTTLSASVNWSAIGLSLRGLGWNSQVVCYFSKIQDFYDKLKHGLIPANELRRIYKEVLATNKLVLG